ncbi:mercuric reductase [soil metagenome]
MANVKEYDAIVIGSGVAGTPLAKKLANAGWKTVLIEKRWVGGTCTNDGCTPTKTMIASAREAFQAGRCSELGVTINGFSVSIDAVIDRKDEIVQLFRNHAEEAVLETKNLSLIYGNATFLDDKTIEVLTNEGPKKTLTAKHIFIVTGTSPQIPDTPGLNNSGYYTTTTLMDLREIPEHLIIMGGGYIALEFSQMYQRFGSKVTILERDEVFLQREDDDLAEEIRDILTTDGIDIVTGCIVNEVNGSPGKVTLQVTAGGKKKTIKGSHLLVAAGRTPNTEELNLAAAGVKVDEKGYIITNNKLQTNKRHIYALGEVNGGPKFTHIAFDDYRIVTENLLNGGKASIAKRLVSYCIFMDPQVGRVGITEKEAKEQGLDYKIAKLPMRLVARAIETSNTKGFYKAIVDAKTHKILGAAILGQQGGEIVTVVQVAMMGGLTYHHLRNSPIAHPTYAESLNNLFAKVV